MAWWTAWTFRCCCRTSTRRAAERHGFEYVAPMRRIAILGGSGNLARPVIRRMLPAGYEVRVLTRDPARAATLLPRGVEIAACDIRDPESIARGVDGCQALYINLTNPISRKLPDAEVIGTLNAVIAARRAGVERILRISALGVHAGDSWWAILHKAEADRAVMECGVPYTIFRPAWFMESLAMFIVGGRLLMSMQSPMQTWWIAGDDYARQVVAALERPRSINRVYDVQGQSPMSLGQAARRFARAWKPRLTVVTMPAAARRVMPKCRRAAGVPR